MLNWIARHTIVLTFKNCVFILNWIVWNGTVFVSWTEMFEIELFWHLTVCKQNYTELFELELFD